jgi:parvulin-like peptidyl-prolyl isomerase
MKRIILAFLVLLLACPLYAEETVVAIVNGTKLTMKDLEAQVDRLIPRMTFHRSVSEDKRKKYYKQALDEGIIRELQYQDAVAQGIKPDKEKTDARVQQWKKRFITEEGFKADLEKRGMTEETLRGEIEKENIVQEWLNKKITEPSKLSETELKEYYEKNKSRFNQPESLKLKLISTRDESKVKEILKKLKAGEDFGSVAYEMSEDAYRVKGGDLGYMHKGRLLPEIEKVAFSLKTGELSEPFKAGDLWYIIKTEDKKPEKQMSFEEVKNSLKKDLETQREQQLTEKLNSDLKAKAKIEVLLKTE